MTIFIPPPDHDTVISKELNDIEYVRFELVKFDDVFIKTDKQKCIVLEGVRFFDAIIKQPNGFYIKFNKNYYSCTNYGEHAAVMLTD